MRATNIISTPVLTPTILTLEDVKPMFGCHSAINSNADISRTKHQNHLNILK